MWRENEREEGDGLSFGVHLVVFFLCVPRARSFSPEGIFGEWPPREQLAAQLRCIVGCHAEEILRHLGSDFRLPLHTPTDKLTHKHTPVCDSFAAKHRQPFVALDRPSNRFFFFLAIRPRTPNGTKSTLFVCMMARRGCSLFRAGGNRMTSGKR